MSGVPLDPSTNVFNYLGLDPTAPSFPPTMAEMRELLRTLKLLLHPDKAKTNPSAKRAQQELGLDFVVLRAIEDRLDLNRCSPAQYVRNMQSLPKAQWVSTWNPHRIDNGPLFEPLPSWSRRFAAPRALDLSNLPPPGIKGVPNFDGSNARPAIPSQESTTALLNTGRTFSSHRAHVTLAHLDFGGARSCVAIVRLDHKQCRGLECVIWKGEQPLGTVDFGTLVALAGQAYGSMYAGVRKLRLLGVFARVPGLVLDLYVKSLLHHVEERMRSEL